MTMPSSQPTAPGANWKPRFFVFWSGQALSLVGSSLTQFVLIWWITQTTGSANALAMMSLAALLPAAFFSPLGGAVADRFSRRWIMMLADAVTAACILIVIGLFIGGTIQVWHVYVLTFIRSSMQAFQQPAAISSTSNLVPENWLNRVAGMNQALQGVMTIASAPLGALALAVIPMQNALMIDVVTALLGITPLFFIKIPQPRREDQATLRSVVMDIRQGAVYILHRRGLVMLSAVTALVVMVLLPCFSLSPLLVTQHFSGGVNDVALMEGLSGVGMILGGILVSFRPLAKKRTIATLVGYSLSCATIALTGWSPGNMFWLAVVWWSVSGLMYSMGNAPMMALLQSVIPNELQGRVFSLLNVLTGLAGPIGLAFTGPLAERLGVQTTFVLCGVLSTLICLAAITSRDLRNLEEDAKSSTGTGH
ncbi:MAG: MFS transporter [Leptolinea sp.]|jgi:DHA3 family macrolide efflux protein-like MFS transporter|nr:MFS transporter [Leptolinea sp.]